MRAVVLGMLVLVMASFATGVDPVVAAGLFAGILICITSLYVVGFVIEAASWFRPNKYSYRVIHDDGTIEVKPVEPWYGGKDE